MISAVFIQTGPVVTNMVTNLDGTVTVMTSQAMGMSVNFLWVVLGIVVIGWLAWFWVCGGPWTQRRREMREKTKLLGRAAKEKV